MLSIMLQKAFRGGSLSLSISAIESRGRRLRLLVVRAAYRLSQDRHLQPRCGKF